MNAYSAAIAGLALAVMGQCLAAGLATRAAFGRPFRRAWLGLAIAFALLALQDVHTLELALRTGIFDLRQALLAAGVSLFQAGAMITLQKAGTPPPR